jgi:serine/threonine-protein kinase
MVTPHVRLVKKLGEGGMGSVWLADHLRLESQIAVKFIDPLLIAKHPSVKSRFRREATAAARIHSPHVVRTYDHGELDDGTPFIMMELLEGESLGDRLERAGPLSLHQTATVIVQSCKLLRKAHKLGIVHRDLKPDNIFLVDSSAGGSDDEPYEGFDDLFVKILDFGIAKQVTRDGSFATMTGAMLGTPEYMSPEQILSAKEVDHRADLWALAVVAYQCMTGRLPFSGETLGAVFQSVLAGRFPPPSQTPGRLPRELDPWFERALHRDPVARFQSARELANAFVAIAKTLAGEPVGPPLSESTPGDIFAPPGIDAPAPLRAGAVTAPHGSPLAKPQIETMILGPGAPPPPTGSAPWQAGSAEPHGATLKSWPTPNAEAITTAQPSSKPRWDEPTEEITASRQEAIAVESALSALPPSQRSAASASGQTFAGAEHDIHASPKARRGRWLVAALGLFVVALAAGVAFVTTRAGASSTGAANAPVPSSAPPSSGSPSGNSATSASPPSTSASTETTGSPAVALGASGSASPAASAPVGSPTTSLALTASAAVAAKSAAAEKSAPIPKSPAKGKVSVEANPFQ